MRARARARGALARAEPSARASRASRAARRRATRASARTRDDDDDDDDARARQFLRLARDARDGSWALQSATVTLRRRGGGARARATLRVCALVHYGEARYYRGVTKDFETRDGDATLVELITSEENLTSDDDGGTGLRRLGTALAPTAEARKLASAHGLTAQLDALDARRRGWYVADVTREELIALRREAGEMTATTAAETTRDGKRSAVSTGTNLPPALEAMAVTAFGRASEGDPARLFARMSCWFVPCPEAHLLLLDWVWAGGRPSEVLGAMVDCCASGDLESARRLAFAQMIVSAQAEGPAGGGSTEPVLVARRNDVAMDAVNEAFKTSEIDTVNLLYGGLHVPGLVRCARERLDMEVVDVAWRDAWRVRPPKNASPLRYAIVPLILGIDGTDWAQTLHDAVALGASAGILSTFLYIVRHGALYYALGKWLLEWNRQLFDADVGPSPENVKYR